MKAQHRFKLPKAFRKKWLEALRSGEYKQISGQLMDVEYDEATNEYFYDNPIGFCCLGVACDIVGHKEELNQFMWDGYPSVCFDREYNNVFKKLPKIIRESSDQGGDFTYIVAGMNDDGKSFTEIADWIENNTIAT